MPLLLTAASHLDHGLSPEHVAFVLALFHDRSGFFLETVTLPAELASLESALYGPLAGDAPVTEADVSYVVREGRRWASRVLAYGAPLLVGSTSSGQRPTRQLTVIGGPMSPGENCTLYTAYGGPAAPREPGDLTLPDWEAVQVSRTFWTEHALAR
jgi:hypothetical protein